MALFSKTVDSIVADINAKIGPARRRRRSEED
jgi:hypothetical protein